MNALQGNFDVIKKGTRKVNDNLRLGVFTQDLAQQLDIQATALHLVASHATEGPNGNIAISHQTVRSAMGRLGLSQDKPLRPVGQLSGGEKARVALAMFSLKPSNVLCLDEPSNHLDQECVDALSQALSNWGGDGAVVVVSHDKAFCEIVGFTHVGTVSGGTFLLEERGLTHADWDTYDIRAVAGAKQHQAEQNELSPKDKLQHAKLRKRALNAPKRIAKLEQLIEMSELNIARIQDEMMEHGNDIGKLMDLNKDKENEEEKIMQFMNEWEDLEALVTHFQS